jgi:hypothetical protein
MKAISLHKTMEVVHNFNYYAFVGFLILGLLVIWILFFKKIWKNGIVTILLFLIASSGLMILYDQILPELWMDARGDVITAQKVVNHGAIVFLKEYHIQSSKELNKTPILKERFDKYDSLIPLIDYGTKLNSFNNQSFIEIDQNRSIHHPPLWFLLTGWWGKIFGTSDGSYKVMIKIVAILFFISLFNLLKTLYPNNKRNTIGLLFMLLLTPSFLLAAEVPKNDFLLGIGTTWMVFFISRNNENKFSKWDIFVGISIVFILFSKFTGIIVIIPLFITYAILYKFKSIIKLSIVALPVLIFYLSFFYLFEYDILFNIISGRSYQDGYVMLQNKNILSNIIINKLLYGFYRVGFPFILLLIPTFEIIQKNTKKKIELSILSMIIFYFSIFLILWGSSVNRHQLGFVAFFLFPLAYFIKNQDYNKYFKVASLLLMLYNILFILNKYIRINNMDSFGDIVTY